MRDQGHFRFAQWGWGGLVVVQELWIGAGVVAAVEGGLQVQRDVFVARFQRYNHPRQPLRQVDPVQLAKPRMHATDRHQISALQILGNRIGDVAQVRETWDGPFASTEKVDLDQIHPRCKELRLLLLVGPLARTGCFIVGTQNFDSRDDLVSGIGFDDLNVRLTNGF